ncbi:MAG TPA: GNAT family N-acetyltransferase [Candidatus Saccharicenans sp.]|nr:GNAT family N-acetyltransferase [Candidatus Saccharicenans sp.]HQM73964.1 GNAT family N-acetyltransferase [Candidatus Saccharicenans sp.]
MEEIETLDKIFKPQRIALVGVSPNPKSVSGKILSNLITGGYRGVVYPVNPAVEAVMGIPCFPEIKSLPRTPDLAVIAAPAPQVPPLVKECGEAGILGIIIISAGFRETGQEGRALEEEILAHKKNYPGMRIIGPNCLGIISPGFQLNASFAAAMPLKGHIAFVSQSGALCTSILDWSLREKIGFSHFVSIGNAIDIDFGDLIDYFGEDENTRSILLYIESIANPKAFMSAARAYARTKPLVAYKAGRFPQSARAATSHTGALASEDAIYDAAFKRAGIARVFEIGEMFDVAELIGRQKIPKGPRLAIVTNAGGPGVMASDALIEAGGELAELTAQTIQQLNEILPPAWSHGNPVDVLGDARSKTVAKAVKAVLDDQQTDAVLLIVTPQAMTNPPGIAKELVPVASETQKPVLAAFLGGPAMDQAVSLLNEAGVPTYGTPEQAVRAFMILVNYARNLDNLYETPREISVEFPVEREKIRQEILPLLTQGTDVLDELTSKKILQAYGLETTLPRLARSKEEAVKISQEIGFPVVLKIHSPDITHKSDVGGVALDLEDGHMVETAFERLLATVKERAPEARIEGVTVQKMIKSQPAVEMILGSKKDETFGAVIMVGSGGIAAEVLGDRSLCFPPLNERLARRALEELKTWPLLKGYRGQPPVNLDKLIETIIRFSYLVADYPEIKEIDINPLLASPGEVIALDARIIVDKTVAPEKAKRYQHLVLRPYPEEFIRKVKMRDGTEITLRPIRPEDEPAWMELLGSCSQETIYSRFRYFFFWQSHEVASRYCYIDYDREMAIVAELQEGDKRRLLGIGRLTADPSRTVAEYAVLVQDDWQNKGLGGLLTDYCTEIARAWGVKKIVAYTTTDNPRMIAVFQKRNFEIRHDPASSLVEIQKNL